MKNKFLYILVFLSAFVLVADFCMIFSIKALAIGLTTEKSEAINQEIISGGEEIVIEEARLYFQLPSDEWKFAEKSEVGKSKRTLYVYKRKPITDKSGTIIISGISVIVEKLPKNLWNTILYSSSWRTRLSRKDSPYKRLKWRAYFFPAGVETFGPKEKGYADFVLRAKSALGTVYTYYDPGDRKHTLISVHDINTDISPDENIGIVFGMDVTTELFPIIRKEFIFILKTIKFDESTNK